MDIWHTLKFESWVAGKENQRRKIMAEEKKNIIEVGSEEWEDLKAEIVENYADGSLIGKGWLHEKFMIKPFRMEDYENTAEMLKAYQEWVFSYLGVVDVLKRELLLEFKVCLKTVWGQGYIIVPSEEQVRYGYDEFISDVRKAIRNARLIMNHVAPVPPEQQAQDNDLRAKFGIMQQMLEKVKRVNV